MPVEIAVQDPAGAYAAKRGGAERLEVCAALALGGISPSIATIETCLEAGLPALPLIRPRPGDFTYNAREVDVTTRDITAAMKAGSTGVVIGALAHGRLDHDTLRTWSDAALQINPEAQIVIHRCVDVLQADGVDAEQLADMLSALPVTRVLTSGGAAGVPEGLNALAALHDALAPHNITVQAGGGLTLESIPTLVSAGIQDVHLSASSTLTTGPSGPGGGPSDIMCTDEAIVAETVAALRSALATQG